MFWTRLFAAALLSAAACAADTAVTGNWNCTNESISGARSRWTMVIKEDGAKLSGILADGEIELALSDVKVEGSTLAFRFFVNEKPYTFEGKTADGKIEGKYAGEEASGTLRCARPAK